MARRQVAHSSTCAITWPVPLKLDRYSEFEPVDLFKVQGEGAGQRLSMCSALIDTEPDFAFSYKCDDFGQSETMPAVLD